MDLLFWVHNEPLGDGISYLGSGFCYGMWEKAMPFERQNDSEAQSARRPLRAPLITPLVEAWVRLGKAVDLGFRFELLIESHETANGC